MAKEITTITGLANQQPVILNGMAENRWQFTHRVGFGSVLGLCGVVFCLLVAYLAGVTPRVLVIAPVSFGLGSLGVLLVTRVIRNRIR
ncbi:hypothetical protein [Streptomyces fildesensis]|uniref:hypothetical protein n=1 Tax=Streptomyces fildesensis TaxID=375757 RepID=UPI0018DF7F93|nr:hypothetical protein [Streptomyces fildesensis]